MNQKALLTREQILASRGYKYEDVDVPAWGGVVRVRDIGGAARDKLSRFFHEHAADLAFHNWEFKILICALAVCDANGEPIFTAADMDELGLTCRESLDLVADVATRISGLAKTATEDEAKNSGSNQSDDSGSASPVTSAAQ